MSNGADSALGPKWILSLIISGEKLDFEGISSALALQSTDTRTKGELLNKLPPIVSEEDCWLYEIPLADHEGLDPRMHDLLQALEAAKCHVARWQEQYEVILRLYVQSDYAQIFYRLMPDTLRRLAEIGLPLEVSVVSWGGFHFQTEATV